VRVLIVEDDEMIGASLVRGLSDEDHVVDWVQSGELAEAALNSPVAEFQMAVLDLGLPNRSGIEVLKALRAAGDNILVLIITARDTLDDLVQGLDQGADDFLVKPFELQELKARMRALARRHAGRIAPTLRTSTLLLDTNSRSVLRQGKAIKLSAREYALLHALMERPGAVFSRAQLESRIYAWGVTVESNAIEFLLHKLRGKIGAEQVENVRGLGWRIRR
jgi:two-component system, OmpR family, response regulator